MGGRFRTTEGGSTEAGFAGRQTRAARPKGEPRSGESIPPITTRNKKRPLAGRFLFLEIVELNRRRWFTKRGSVLDAAGAPQGFDRTPELEHDAMWESEQIRLPPSRTRQAVSRPVIGTV